jgi:hypothetical protein
MLTLILKAEFFPLIFKLESSDVLVILKIVVTYWRFHYPNVKCII